MAVLTELRRFSFVAKRDGHDKAIAWARQMRKVYAAAARARGRRDEYRKMYALSAWSLRWLSRAKIVPKG